MWHSLVFFAPYFLVASFLWKFALPFSSDTPGKRQKSFQILFYYFSLFYVWIFVSAAPRQLWRRLGDDTQKRFDSRGGRTTHLQELKKNLTPLSLSNVFNHRKIFRRFLSIGEKILKRIPPLRQGCPQTNPNLFVTFFDGDRLFTCLCRNNKVDKKKKKPDDFDRTMLLERINRMVISENVEGPDEFLPIGGTHNSDNYHLNEKKKKCLRM